MIVPPRDLLGAAILAAAVLVAVLLLPRVVAAAGVGAIVLLLALLAGRLAGRPRLADQSAAQAPAPPERLQPLLDLLAPLPHGVALLDDELLVVAANPALARLVDRPLEEMLGASLIRATRDYDLTAIARERPPEAREVQLASGETVRVSAAPLEPPLLDGRATLALVVEDVTALRAAQQARTDLVANLSHELRTPIAGARAIAETLQTTADDPLERERFLGLLVDELERMSELVQRMLRLAQLESERQPLELEAVSPAALLEAAAERFAPLAGRQGVRVEIEDVAPEAVRANRERAEEVLANLVDNALRHSPSGSCVRLAARTDEGPDGPAVRFEVRDEGPGILLQERDRVFERFYTGDSAREAGSHTGLGLAIARQLVQQQGGRIWVADSTPGATLCFTLEAASAGSTGG